MKVLAEKNNKDIIGIVVMYMIALIMVAFWLAFGIKWADYLDARFHATYGGMAVLFLAVAIIYTVYFCRMPKVIMSINSNYELVLPHNRVIPLARVEKLYVRVYGRQVIELYPRSGMLFVKTASKTYRYYFVKNPDDVQEKITMLLYEFRQYNQQYCESESIVY